MQHKILCVTIVTAGLLQSALLKIPLLFYLKNHSDDVILRNQPTKVVDEAPKHRVREAAEINVVSCVAYVKSATSNNIDREDYEEMANLTSEFRQNKIDYDDEDYV